MIHALQKQLGLKTVVDFARFYGCRGAQIPNVESTCMARYRMEYNNNKIKL